MAPIAGKLSIMIVVLGAAMPAAASTCEGGKCKVQVPEDDVNLMQVKLERGIPEDLHEEIQKEVEAGKRELRDYARGLASADFDEANQTSGPPMLAFSDGSCPSNWDNTAAPNDATIQFINKCLKDIKTNELTNKLPKRLGGAPYQTMVNGCGGGVTNSVHHATNTIFKVKGDKNKQEGGVCEAKAYKVKCSNGKIPDGCKMFRAYANGNRESGGYWGADPRHSGLTKDQYREAYAICDDWQGSLDKVTEGTLTDQACDSVVMIGNGEKVTNCKKKTQIFPYSQYLQMIPCALRDYPNIMTLNGGLSWS